MLFLGFHFRWAEGVTLSLPLLPAFRTLPAAGGDAVHVFRRIHSFFLFKPVNNKVLHSGNKNPNQNKP